jgi:hypothetical protein
MDSLKQLLPRDPPDFVNDDESYGPSMSSLALTFFSLVLVASILTLALICLRRKRLARQRQHAPLLPSYNHSSHRRAPSMTNIPTIGRNDSIFVYDEKMNLIANSSSPPSSAVPEIRLTFPDDEDRPGQSNTGRVVVVHVTDTGSIGMAPLNQEPLPPYQRSEGGHFQSLDLDRIGGLREKDASTPRLA